jgi:lipopolysaccharide export system ATP-binding protein
VTAILRLDSIGKRFGARKVLTSAYFDALPGSVTALVGRNGAGKSTLMKIAAGWLRADHGTIEFRGERHLHPRPGKLARDGLFYLPVDRSILSPVFTLSQHLDALEARFGPRDRASVLERLRIAHLAATPCAALSGGERRRAELAVGLLRQPACLLLDEPFHGIDPRDAEVVLAAVAGIAAAGCAVVVSGHEMGWLLPLADRVVWVYQGTTRPLGTRDEAAAHWEFRREYLGARA